MFRITTNTNTTHTTHVNHAHRICYRAARQHAASRMRCPQLPNHPRLYEGI
jgi:hypothetical protein